MRLIIRSGARAVAETVAKRIRAAVAARPSLVLGLPTGRTPIPVYRRLVAECRAGHLDLDGVTTFNLDEFVGLAAVHPGSYHAFMERHLFRAAELRAAQRHVPRGDAASPDREAVRYEAAIHAAGGFDLVVLGIGDNGHIGFNEPAPALTPATHVVRLQPGTRRANAWLFGGRSRNVPTRALTVGVGTILQARSVLLLATGRAKAGVVARALEGPITTRVPASLLQAHPNCVVVLDRAAASRLAKDRRGHR